ncbi:MAG: MucB/RseB C-terminal domain-containing protein [Gammaproteobacteria bacterium]
MSGRGRTSGQRLRLVGAGLLLLVGWACHADDQARNLLREMHDATRHSNYDGIFVYQRGVQLDTMRLVHMYDGDAERERLISLSGPAREVIRDGTRVTCLFADDHAAMVERAPPRDIIGIGFSAPVDALVDNYRFSVEGRDRIAGRDAMIVGVTPRRDDRYAYQLWIDAASKLLLKSIILGRGGRVLEQVQFTRIDLVDQPDPARLQPEIGGSGFTWHLDDDDSDVSATGAEVAQWQVNWVPEGFELKENDVQNMATSKMPVDHLVYSDGLAMVSVFIEALMEGEPPLQGYSARGAVNAFSRIADNHQITVVGEVPLPTVRQIAASVSREP